MADAYSDNSQFVLMETGRKNWGTIVNANLTKLDGYSAIGGLVVVPAEVPASTSLNVIVKPGVYLRKSDGAMVSFGGGTLLLSAVNTHSIYLNSSGVPASSTTGFPAGEIVRLATVVAGASSITSITDTRTMLESSGVPAPSLMGASGPGHKGGLVPDTPAAAGTTRFLNEDATWRVVPVMIGAGATHAPGLVPDPPATASTLTNHRFLRDNGTWVQPPNFVGSGSNAAPGYVPSPGSPAGNRKVLLENGTWGTMPVFGISGAGAALGAVPAPPSTPGAQRYIREDGVWVDLTLVGSGPSAVPGLAPNPPAVAGNTKFLCENAFWQVPGGSVVNRITRNTQNTAEVDTVLVPLTTSETGIWQVDVYALVASSGTSGNWTFTLNWQDDQLLTRSQTLITLAITSLSNFASGSYVLQARNTAGSPKFTTAFTGTIGSGYMNYYVIVRKLSL